MLFSLVSVGFVASSLVQLGFGDDDDNNGRECTREAASEGAYRFDETYCKFYLCECTDSGNKTTCEYSTTVQWFDEDNDDRLELILDYCSYTCGSDDLVFDGSNNCTCSNVECEDGTEGTPSPTAQDNGDGDSDATRSPDATDDSDDDDDSTPSPTDDGRGNSDATRTPETTDSSDRDDTPAPTATDNGDDSSDEMKTTTVGRSTPEPTSDDGRDTPSPTRQKDSDEDSDDNDRDTPEPTKARDSDDSDDDNNKETPSPTRRDYDDDYDLDEDAEKEFYDDDSVDDIRDEDKTKPYLVTQFKLTITKAWYYRPDFDAILKRALRLLLAGSSDYIDDIAFRYVIRFEAERNDEDNDGNNDDDEDGDRTNDEDDTRNNDEDDNDENSDGDAGRGRRLLETLMKRVLLEDDETRANSSDVKVRTTDSSDDDSNVRATESSDESKVRTTDSSDDDNTKVRTTDSSDDDNRYRTTVYIDDKCNEVSIKLYVGLAVYIDDIVIIERLYNYLLALANRLGDEFAVYCANTAKLYRGCGWGIVDVYYASLAYYDENGVEVESQTFTDDSDDDNPTSGSIKIQSISINLMIIATILSMFVVV